MSSGDNDKTSGAEWIGAHYVTWLYPENFEDDDWTGECVPKPARGNYDCTDESVIEEHAAESLDHGLNWWWMSWWGEDHVSDDVFESFLRTDGTNDVGFSVLYESAGLLEWTDDGTADLDDPVNRDRLVEHFEYFEEEFFDEPNYVHFDGKPVVFMFSSQQYVGDVAAAFDAVEDAIGREIYFVGDEVVDFTDVGNWTGPTEAELEALPAYDAVTTYSSWKPREDIDDVDFVDRVMDCYAEWEDACREHDVAFIPQVMPGYDDTAITHVSGREAHPVLSRDPERFADMCDRACGYLDPDVEAAFITSFNEWFEGSSVESSADEGAGYMEVVNEHLASE